MADNLVISFKAVGDGRVLATVNGKSYTVLAAYEHWRAGGWFFLALAGRTPLKPDDLDKHWKVIRQGNIYFAFAERLFSYHLIDMERDPPDDCDWPRLKAAPEQFAVVGPTEPTYGDWPKARLVAF